MRLEARRPLPWLLASALVLAGLSVQAQPAPAPSPQDGVDATLWVQRSAEYRACALQAYHLATCQLQAALADRAWTASLEQREQVGFGALPPAVILDADETVLDNSAFQADLIRTGGSYTPDGWLAWVNSAQALAVPGAVDFCQRARRQGVAVYFVSNRKAAELEGTTRNLKALGFPVEDGSVLIRPDGASKDKAPRRAQVGATHRILLLVGDNGADFASGFDAGEGAAGNEARLGLAADDMDLWGTKWIIIPNPMYGRWLDNVVGTTPPADREKVKWDALRVPAPPKPATTQQAAPGMSDGVQGAGGH